MTYFDKNELEKLEKLCRIKLTEEEKKSFLTDLKKIIQYIEQLEEIDTSNVDPCCNIQSSLKTLPLREDTPKSSLNLDEFLANAPDKIGTLIKVPSIMKEE